MASVKTSDFVFLAFADGYMSRASFGVRFDRELPDYFTVNKLTELLPSNPFTGRNCKSFVYRQLESAWDTGWAEADRHDPNYLHRSLEDFGPIREFWVNREN